MIMKNDLAQYGSKLHMDPFPLEFKLNHKAAETARNINKVFRYDTVKERKTTLTMQKLQKLRFSCMNLENVPRKNAASVIKNNELRTLIVSDPRQTIMNMAEQLGVHYSEVFRNW